MAETPVALAGLGSIGGRVGQALAAGLPGLHLAAVAASTPERAAQRVAGWPAMRAGAPAIVALDEIPEMGEIVVECLPPALFGPLARAVLARGKTLVAASVGGLLACPDVLEMAQAGPGRLVVPSGAIGGLDALAAAREAGLEAVLLRTRKPPAAFGATAPAGPEAQCIFAGNAAEAVARFPKNINVAATISLAGLGPERTRVQIWADPAVRENTHEIEIVSRAGRSVIAMENLPDPENPKSSMITGYSILAALRRLSARVVIGS